MGAAAAAGLIEVGKTNDDAPRRGMTVVEIENLPPTTEPCELRRDAFALVTFDRADDAEHAVNRCDGARLDGGRLRFQICRRRQSHVMGVGAAGGMADASTKTHRELFVGNTPPDASETVLRDFLNAAMHQVNLVASPGDPVVQCRVSNKFAFIELRTVEEANACLNINGIPFMGNMLKVSRPTKYTGPETQSSTWQQLTGAAVDTSGIDPTTKVYRELFVGNTSPEMSEVELQEFLGAAMQQVGLTTSTGNPIVTTRLSGKFAFVELRSIEETNNCLNLNGIPYMGMSLRVGRPSKYAGPTVPHLDWPQLLQKYMAGELPSANNTAAAAAAPPPSSLGGAPTRVIKLGNMVTMDDLANDEDYNDVLEEMREECGKFGAVANVVIPRGAMGQPGVGSVFVEFQDENAAHASATALGARTFDGKRVEAQFYSEECFRVGDYSS